MHAVSMHIILRLHFTKIIIFFGNQSKGFSKADDKSSNKSHEELPGVAVPGMLQKQAAV